MKVFTSRPIIEKKSNCCGGMSSADGNPTTSETTVGGMVKDYMSEQKSARKDARGKAVSDVLAGSSSRRETRRGARETSRALRLENKDKRLAERIQNREARAKRRSDRKAKRNAKKLLLIKTPRSTEPKFFFPLQKLRLSKKKKRTYEKVYPDGKVAEVPAEMVVTDVVTGVTYDKKEISNATGVPTAKVTPETIKSVETTTVVDPTTKDNTLAIETNDNLVSGADDGNAYLASDIQGSQEPPKDVAEDDKKKDDEKKGWSTTTKVIVGVGAVAVVGLIIYAVVKGKSAVPKV